MYRVYDTERKRWVKDNIYLSPNPYSDLYIFKKSFFGKNKLISVFDDRYIVHKDTNLYDKYGYSIYEGDYVRATVSEDRTVIGQVAYACELAAYVILCMKSEEYFTLGQEVCEFIQVIGNVFDGCYEE